MIWVTWRQHRKQALFAVVGLAVLAALLVPTGRQMYRAMVDTGLANCLEHMSRSEFIAEARGDPVTGLPDCEAPADQFNNQFSGYALPAILLVFLPPCWLGCSSARRWSPARSSTAPTAWYGPRV